MTQPYFRPCTPGNELSALSTDIRRHTYFMWQHNRPDPDDDFDIATATLAGLTGESVSRVRHIIMACYRLDELPRLKELVETHFHLDFNRLIAIDTTLAKLGELTESQREYLDDAITDLLTPTAPGQHLIGAYALRTRLDALIDPLDERIDAKKKSSPTDSLTTTDLPGGVTALNVELDTTTAAIVNQHLTQAAQAHNISKAEALVKLTTGQIRPTAEVILHLYQATDLPEAPAFLREGGWIPADQAAALSNQATVTRDMGNAAHATSSAYSTPAHISAFVEGRDGTCRWPGCVRAAQDCQKDHRINHVDGGPTTATNLASLCQHHHNIKTDRRAFYILDPHTGDIYWLFNDGTWLASSPSGPLAPSSCNWLQTTAQAISARNRNAHDRAAKEVQPV